MITNSEWRDWSKAIDPEKPEWMKRDEEWTRFLNEKLVESMLRGNAWARVSWGSPFSQEACREPGHFCPVCGRNDQQGIAGNSLIAGALGGAWPW